MKMVFDLENYIVYKVLIDTEIVYIGSGKIGREKHCDSGTSHCYELNKCHHTGVPLDVKIHKMYLTKQESLELEKELIMEHQPRFNKVYIVKDKFNKASAVKRIIKELKDTCLSFYGYTINSDKTRSGVTNCVRLFCRDGSIFEDWYKIHTHNVARSEFKDDKDAFSLYRKLRDSRYQSKCMEWMSCVFDFRVEGTDIYIRAKEEFRP